MPNQSRAREGPGPGPGSCSVISSCFLNCSHLRRRLCSRLLSLHLGRDELNEKKKETRLLTPSPSLLGTRKGEGKECDFVSFHAHRGRLPSRHQYPLLLPEKFSTPLKMQVTGTLPTPASPKQKEQKRKKERKEKQRG